MKLRKFNQRGKNKNKNKNKKKGSPLHADINGTRTNGRMYSNSEGNAPNVKRESYVKAINVFFER